jgi:hypothetical protein
MLPGFAAGDAHYPLLGGFCLGRKQHWDDDDDDDDVRNASAVVEATKLRWQV